MSMKKILSVLVACGIIVSVLAACGSNPVTTDEKTNTSISESVADSSSESETSNDETKPTEPGFLPPAEHSNYIAPKAQKGQKYEIKELDCVNGKDFSAMDANHFSVDNKEVYDLDGNMLFTDEAVKKDYSKELSYVSIHEMVQSGDKNYAIVYLQESSSESKKYVLYNYLEHSFFELEDSNYSVYEANEEYIVISDNKPNFSLQSVIDWNKKTIIPFDAGYTFIEYLYNDRFIAQKGESNCCLLNSSGNVVCTMPSLGYTTFKGLMHHQTDLGGSNYRFYDKNNLTNDYFIGTKQNYSGEKWLGVSVSIFDRDGKEVYSYEAPDINYPIRMVSQYNGKTYISEYIDDYYYFEESGQKHQKIQLIDEYKNKIIEPCGEMSGFFNGYCFYEEVNPKNKTITTHLVDLEKNEIDSVERPLYMDNSGSKSYKYLSIVDEQGLYILEDYSNNASFYTIKDTAGNIVFTSDSEIKNINMLGNGVFGVISKGNDSISKYNYLIKITPA